MIPTLFEIPMPFNWGSLPIHSFGLSMIFAFLAAWRLLVLTLRKYQEDEALAEQLVTWAAFGGIIGARILYVVSFPQGLSQDPLGTIFGGAGFVYYGGFIGGAGAVCFLLHRNKKSILLFSDLIAPSLAIGYAVGRIGCQLSGDGDYGMPTSLPWGLQYPLGVVPTDLGVRVHPAPIYESLLALALCFILLAERVQQYLSYRGQIFGLYLIGAAFSRYIIEFIRIEPVVAFGLTQAQITAVIIAIVGLTLMLPRGRVRRLAAMK